MLPRTEILQQWRNNPALFTPEAWVDFIQHQPFPFNPAALTADSQLWGDFWQGDVIAPGYKLPALELAYLRVTRLDNTFKEADPAAYLATLQTALKDFPAGAWLTELDSQLALCLAYPINQPNRALVIWLTQTTLVAGYKDPLNHSPGYHLTLLKPSPPIDSPSANSAPTEPPPYLLEGLPEALTADSATRMDCLIRLHRAYNHLRHTQAAQDIIRYIEAFCPSAI